MTTNTAQVTRDTMQYEKKEKKKSTIKVTSTQTHKASTTITSFKMHCRCTVTETEKRFLPKYSGMRTVHKVMSAGL